jgi:fatty aldehyde-generating acyl-ACP reductase
VHDAQDSTHSIDPPGGAAPRGRFAFLVHPLAPVRQDMARLARPLGLLPDRLFEAAFAHLPVRAPQVATYTAEDRPDQLLGRVYGVPLSPRQLLHAPRPMVHDRIDRAVDQAVEAGATVVGLGALTAPAVSGGEALRYRTDIGVTNGNAFTAAMTAEGVRRVAAPGCAVALVGATGSVGSAVAELLARDGYDLTLIARNPARLATLRDRLGPARTSTDMSDARAAAVVVLLTSSTDNLLRAEHLGQGAVVMDCTQPRNTSPGLLADRPDVTVLDGGVVAIPGLRRRGHLAIAADRAWACLAETMLLALADHRGHATVGNATLADVDRLTATAGRMHHLGFHLAEPTSFGRPVEVEGWGTVAVTP